MSNIQQYADYTNSSDLFLDTAIDDKGALSSLAEEMNYRLALTLNQLVSTSADALNGTDNTVNQQLAVGTYLTASNLRTIAQQLESVNVRPFEDNTYAGVINPLVVHDLYNDASFNGLTDIMKRQGDTAKKLGLEAGFYWNFKDTPHVQLPIKAHGLSWDQLDEAYRQGKYPKVFALLDQHGPW